MTSVPPPASVVVVELLELVEVLVLVEVDVLVLVLVVDVEDEEVVHPLWVVSVVDDELQVLVVVVVDPVV